MFLCYFLPFCLISMSYLLCIKSLPQKYLSHIHKSVYINSFSFSAKSFLLWVLFIWLFTHCLHDKWTWASPSFWASICLDSHAVFLQNMISVLHSLLSSLFLPQDIRQYSYHHIHWTLLLFAVLLSFSRLSSLNFFKDLLFGQISWTYSFFATITAFVPIPTSCVLSYFCQVYFYSTWTNTQKETCNVFHIFFLFPFMIHQFFYNSLHISHYKHVAIKKKKVMWVAEFADSIFCWAFLSGNLLILLFLPIVALHTGIFDSYEKSIFKIRWFFIGWHILTVHCDRKCWTCRR